MNRFIKWAQREYSFRQRLIALVGAGTLVIIVLPILLLRAASTLDQRLLLPRYSYGLPNYLIGGIITAIGFFFAMWSVQIQFTRGRGTPIPIMAAQKLVVRGPFAYCRNPMSLGIFLFYGGFGIWVGSISAILIVLIFAILLVAYIKIFEEKELEARFGNEYLEYKLNTPFLLPNFRTERDNVSQARVFAGIGLNRRSIEKYSEIKMQLQKNLQDLLFHPLVAPATSLLTTLVFVFLIILKYEGEGRHYLLYYFAPLVIPYVAFVFDRLKNWNTIHNTQRLIDIFVLVVSMMRLFITVPFTSGHALILTYIALSTHSLLARISAALVLLEVFYIKIFLWNDFSFFGGALLGILAAVLFRWIKKQT